jgi:spore coat polysaccharide biosynthesis predicted glycosyltransferase SpsG
MDMGILTREQAREMYRMLWEIISQNPDIHFIIKVHPSEDIKTYSMVIFGNRIGANYSITQTASIPDLLKIADIQISMASYTSFEAVVAGVPIIILHPEFVNFFNQFEGIGQTATNIGSFNVKLKVALRPTGRMVFASQRKDYLDKKLAFFGNSAEITANTIKKVIDWKKPGFK